MWMGWLSSAFYLSSRLSQLYKNWSRKCCEGLSATMFLCAISANVRRAAAGCPPCSRARRTPSRRQMRQPSDTWVPRLHATWSGFSKTGVR